MNCEYRLSILVDGGAGASLRIRADEPVPIDGLPAWVETQLYCQTIAAPQPFQAGERKAGTGLVRDGGLATTFDELVRAWLRYRPDVPLEDFPWAKCRGERASATAQLAEILEQVAAAHPRLTAKAADLQSEFAGRRRETDFDLPV